MASDDISQFFSSFSVIQYRHIHYTIDGMSDNWNWNIGALAPLEVDRRWNFLNPKLGVNFTSGDHRAFVSWAVAQKEPVRSNFTDGDPMHYPEAERLDDFEAGYTFSR